MPSERNRPAEDRLPPIFILSGGSGASGEQIVLTALAQFPENRIPVNLIGNIRYIEQIEEVIARAKKSGGIIVHTLVDTGLRNALIERARQAGVPAVDLMGELIGWVRQVLGQEPLGIPGIYRQLHKDYFERVAAIEYSMAHDDGKHPEGWIQADILLVGVSRTGKTPLSLYLSVLGWKVANLPIVPGIRPPGELSELDRRTVVGLTIEPGQLLLHRQQRQRNLGAPGASQYVDPLKVYEEVREAEAVFRRGGFAVIDVTDKPLESTADEIIRLVTRQERNR